MSVFDETEAYEMFDGGKKDTVDIARHFGVSEAFVYNSNADFSERVFLSCAEEFLDKVNAWSAERNRDEAIP